MKLYLKLVLALAIISVPFVTSSALENSSEEGLSNAVVERVVISDDATTAREDIPDFDLDDCTNCETEVTTIYAQAHVECTRVAVAEKTKQLARQLIDQAKEDCSANGCGRTLICRAERELIVGGYSCGLTVWISYCCAACPD